MPWEMSSSRNVPKSCSWLRGGWAPAVARIPSSRPCAQPPGTGSLGCGSPRRPIPTPQTLPHSPREVGPARPHGSTRSCPVAAGRKAEGRGQMPGEGQAVCGAAPAAEALGFVSSWLCQWPLPLPALDRVTRNAGSPSPVVCHHLNLSLIASQSNLLFPNIKAPRVILGEAGLPLRIPVASMPPCPAPLTGARCPPWL